MDKRLKAQIDYWYKSAERNWDCAKGLFKLKHYDMCLFMCHLTIEKLLKGLIVKNTKKPAPYIHILDQLSALSGIKFSEKAIENLKIITDFNMSCRYDDARHTFYKKCTKEYTRKYLAISENFYSWLKEEYKKE